MFFIAILLLAFSHQAFADGLAASKVQGNVLVMHTAGNEEIVKAKTLQINSDDSYNTLQLKATFENPVINGSEREGYFLTKTASVFKALSSVELDSGETIVTYKNIGTSFFGLEEDGGLAMHQSVTVALTLNEEEMPLSLSYQVETSVDPDKLAVSSNKLLQLIAEFESVKREMQGMSEQQLRDFIEEANDRKKQIAQTLAGDRGFTLLIFKRTLADLQKFDATGFKPPSRFTAAFEVGKL